VDLVGLGELDRGLEIIEQSLTTAQTFHRMETELQCLASLGETYLTRGECDRAEQVARQLVEASANVANRLAAARLTLGRCWLARNDALQALAILEAGLIDAQASYSKMMILRLHAALSQVVSHPAIAQVHRRIAAELVQQIADSLDDKALRNIFLQSPLAHQVLQI
jgi:thioredoxin-like negative regulator of GroEL